MRRWVDVLVVGAGLAGLECARRLGETGARVLLVDRKPAVDHAVHTTGIFVRRTLESFALPDDCLGPPVRRVALYSPAGRALALESPHDEFRVGRMGPLYRRALEDCLRAGVQWASAARVASLSPDGRGSVAVLKRGGRAEQVRARFVVGADGAKSRVASALGLDENREWIVGVEEVFRDCATGQAPAFHCWLDPVLAPGYIAWVVDDGEEVHVGVGGYACRFRPAEAFRRFLERVAPRFGLERATPSERRGGRIPVGGVLPRIICTRGLLVGDAAGAVSPLTAGGLDPCLRLSMLAASVTADFLDSGDEAALTAYGGATFRARFRKRLLLRRLLSAVRSPFAAELACAALRVPPFHLAARKVFFGRGSFPDPVYVPLRARKRTLGLDHDVGGGRGLVHAGLNTTHVPEMSMDVNARAELQDANDRLLHLIEQDHLEEVRLAAKDRKWMTQKPIPEDLRRRLEDCYDALARALTPEERGLRDVPQAREECRRAAEILKDWSGV